MPRTKGSKNKPKVPPEVFNPGADLKEGVIPETKIVTPEKLSKCVHGENHHDPEKKWCNSCGCMNFNGCGQ